MRDWEIKDTGGAVLHSGPGKTRRGFVESLVAGGKSLSGADLSKHDLSGLDLPKGDFRGARFDGADMRGVQAKGADFTGASFRPAAAASPEGDPRPTRMEGARFDGASFDGADLTEVEASGARFTHATARGAVIDRACFDEASMSGACFAFARGEETRFRGAILINSDFAHAVLTGPDFRGADLSHRAFGGEDAKTAGRLSDHLPDRTQGAKVVAGSYDRETVLAATVPAIRSDARACRMTRMALWCTTTLGLVTAGHYVEPFAEALVGLGTHAAAAVGLAGTDFATAGGGALVGIATVVGAAHFVKEVCGDWLRERTEALLGGAVRRVRQAVQEIDRRFGRRADLVCAMARRHTTEPLRLALIASAPEAGRRGFWCHFRSFFGELGEVVLCDRRHLALALAILSQHARHGIQIDSDVAVIRCDGAHGGSRGQTPCAMRFHMDGRATAVWPSGESGHATVTYGRDGADSR